MFADNPPVRLFFRIHVSVGSLLDGFGIFIWGFAASAFHFPQDGYHPGMQFHTALMAFADGKLPGIMPGLLPGNRQTSIQVPYADG